MNNKTKTLYVDCDAGRRLGCRTFCCRLLVALKPHEREERADGLPAKGYVEKDSRGICVHMDQETWKCKIWAMRPEACREYTCNNDFKLQVAVREGFSNIVDLARKASVAYIPRETYIRVPVMSEDEAVTASAEYGTKGGGDNG